jgi:SAM-dependent methyltransferase
MAHESQMNFIRNVRNKNTWYFLNKKVLDCGSLNINGSNKSYFVNCNYIGIDLAPGRNVDIVSKIHEFDYPDESFDTIISTECFEHDIYYKESIKNIIRLLKRRGLFIFTCATTGRPEHGTSKINPQDSPFTVKQNKEWRDYYKNLTEQDIREIINIDDIFISYEFSFNHDIHDMYFWGIKR